MTTREPDDPRLARISLRKEMIGDGLNDKAIARMLRDGILHRLRFGAYVAGPTWRLCDSEDRYALLGRAVIRQSRAEVVASHLSAAVEWDVPLWDIHLDKVHMTRTDQRAGRREAGVVQHVGVLREEDTVELNGIRVTSPTRTALDCMTVMDVEHSLTTVNDLLHRELTTPEALAEGREFMERWPNTLRQDLVLRLADGRCGGSVGEGRTMYLLMQHSLPRPVPQHPIVDEDGEVFAYVDFAWPEHGVFLEFDGRIKYQQLLKDGESPTDVVLREKRREEKICRLTGWRCIRITWADLARPEKTAAMIRAVLFPVTTVAG